MSDFMVKPIKSDRKVIKSVDLAKWEKDLRNTNVYAEVSGKYARAPVMNGPFTCKSNDYQTFFKFDSDKNSTEKHISILDKRRKFNKRRTSQEPVVDLEIDKDIKILTRLLKIERVKRLIVQKKLEKQE